MKYKLFNEPSQSTLRQILYNRDLKTKEEQDKWINASWNDINSPYAFGKEDVEKAVEMLRAAVAEHTKVCVIVDADADGFTSAAIILNYLYDLYSWNYSSEKVKEQLTYILHDGKQHGLVDIVNKIEDDVKFVIIPDAGTNDITEMQQLVDAGKHILCMDHHESDNWIHNDNVVIINNQICEYPNKDLSGAGVTWQICRAYDDTMGLLNIERELSSSDTWKGSLTYVDLAALGI